MLLQSPRESNTHLAYEEFCTPAWFTEVLCYQETVLTAQTSNSSSLPGGRSGCHQTAVAARIWKPGQKRRVDRTNWALGHTSNGEDGDRAESEKYQKPCEHSYTIILPLLWLGNIILWLAGNRWNSMLENTTTKRNDWPTLFTVLDFLEGVNLLVRYFSCRELSS